MNPYAIVTALVIAIGLSLGGVQVGKKLERQVWQDRELKITRLHGAELDALIAKVEDERKGFATKTRKASEDHEKEIADINELYRAALDRRVRVAFCRPTVGSPPSQSPGAGGVQQAAAPAQFLPDAFASDLRQLARDADEQVADLRQVIATAKAAKCFEGFTDDGEKK